MKAWTVSHVGTVMPATWEPHDDLTIEEVLDTACRVLKLSPHPLHQDLAQRLYTRWSGVGEESKSFIRAHIATILSVHRGLMYDIEAYSNHIDYALLALCQGDGECREYMGLLQKWENSRREKKKEKEKERNSSMSDPRPVDIDISLWADFLEYRAKKKQP